MPGIEESRHPKVVIVGGGPGGYAAAFVAGDLGLDVTLIDNEANPGGVCLYRGCIPSKTLLHIAKVITEAKDAAHWGISFTEPSVDLDKLRASKNAVVEKLTGGLGQLCKARSVRFIQGMASYLDSATIRVIRHDGGEEEIKADYSILAAGSRPSTLPGIYLDSPRLMNSTDALDMDSIPGNLLVIGGGYIGLELGTVYATLGSKVTVVEMTGSLLPGVDADVVRILGKRMENVLDKVLLHTKVVDIKEANGHLEVTLEDKDGNQSEHAFEKVLTCIGRVPNSSGIGLKNTQVEIDEKGFVVTDEQCRTADPHIFAIGDLAGQPMLAHKASHEGRVAAEVIAGEKSAFAPNAIPAVVFTDPEVAWAGITENDAKEQGREIEISRFPWGASGRAVSMHREEGLTKIISDPETGQVLGMLIVGSGAGELIAEGVLAIEMGALTKDVALSIHAHPTLSETVMESAEMFSGQSIHAYRPQK